MLTIRLQRTGKKNAADFRIVLAEKASAVSKKFVEVLGSYNPRRKDFKINEDRLKYWIGQRAELSPTVHNLLVSKNLVEGKKVKAFSIPKKAEEAKPAEEKPAEAPAAEAASEQPASGEAPAA
jgi:small subunit ribosomal protein S16